MISRRPSLRETRRFGEAATAFQQALAIYRQIGDRHGEGRTLNNLGLAQRQLRRFEEAATVAQAAVEIFAELGDEHSEKIAMRNLEGTRELGVTES